MQMQDDNGSCQAAVLGSKLMPCLHQLRQKQERAVRSMGLHLNQFMSHSSFKLQQP